MPSSEFLPLVDAPAAPAGFHPFDPAGTPAEPPVDDGAVAAEEAARAAAFEEGRAAGTREAHAETVELGRGFVQAVEALASFRQTLRERYEQELLQVALGVAKAVVRREVAERPEIWLDMLRAAIGRTLDRERIVVRVPASLAEYLRAHGPELRAALAEVKTVEVVDDPGLPADGCLLESRFGEVDLGVDTQMAEAERALTQASE
jgi:flagellar assembly protein FliH